MAKYRVSVTATVQREMRVVAKVEAESRDAAIMLVREKGIEGLSDQVSTEPLDEPNYVDECDWKVEEVEDGS